jgi:hypothetical protein
VRCHELLPEVVEAVVVGGQRHQVLALGLRKEALAQMQLTVRQLAQVKKDLNYGCLHLLTRLFVERHFVKGHFVERHFVKGHFVKRHFVERHFVETFC